MLIDSVEITVRAGRGGDGVVAWRREKFVPKGGPDGGDGGRGGSVYLVGSNNVDTLGSFRYRKVFQAPDGENGRSKKQYGKAADDLELFVPLGTIIHDQTTGRVLADVTEVNQKIRVGRGGDGGLGNPHFASATHQRPTEQTNGKPGQTRSLRLELQLIADAALVGKPNAGKSSIITALTGVEARIGAYAFSTTEPILGVMRVGERTITLVDLPGLIAGAHTGKGLGDKFLQHLRRVKVIVHVVDATDSDCVASIKEIEHELKQYQADFLEKPRILVLNKADLLTEKEKKILQKAFPRAIVISASAKENLNALRDALIEINP